MRRPLLIVPLLAAAGLLLLRRSTGAPQAPAPANTTISVLVMLGEHANAVERWDGIARVRSGTLARAVGRHFSKGDAITGPGSWKATTRRDDVPPYADPHYTEMRPGSRPEVRFHPVGVYLTVEPAGNPRVSIETVQGTFEFAPLEMTSEPRTFLNARASVQLAPTATLLSTPQFEDDEPAIAALPGGDMAVAWVAYRDRADRILLRIRRHRSWSTAEEVTPHSADIWRCSLSSDREGNLWIFWSQREGDRWQVWARHQAAGKWSAAEPVATEGTNSFHSATAASDGNVFVVYQGFRGRQSDIFLKRWQRGRWSEEMRVSESPANDWEPSVAAGSDGTAYIAWDGYDRGNYDIFFRSFREGSLSPVEALTSSPNFQAHAAIALDAQGRPWVAWDESGVNWGKDQGFLVPTPLAVPLHQERWVRVAMREGASWRELRPQPGEVLPAPMRRNAEHPRIAFDGGGSLVMSFRHWTRRNDRTIGGPMTWENYLTRFDGKGWSTPQPLSDSAGSIEKHAALARATDGALWAAWMTDSRPFSTQIPQNADIWCARLGPPQTTAMSVSAFAPLADAAVEAIPVHSRESEDVKAVRDYVINDGARSYKIYRGDMHRHTDVSQDFKYDGSLLELYRYALDAASFDYIAPTDHQAGYDQEFTWWQNQKLVDLFYQPGVFTPLYAYERSIPYPNGHRNVIFDHRGVRTLPVPPEEMQGKTGAAKLYEYLKRNRGISMPHSTATDQGTDWRDNDPEVEPLVEIYQGYRNSYEYEGAPRSATALNPQVQKSGWQPAGFWWNALVKGYKLGVQSSSDHWSTHISYACIVASDFTREGLMEALRGRHAYAATDNIVLDFRAIAGGKTYLMGDAISASAAPRFILKTIGTGPIKQVDLIKDRRFVYTARPGSKEASFEYTDGDSGPGESWYYVRVLQEDGQLAWSSPVWVKR
jgi:hypothetical protein